LTQNSLAGLRYQVFRFSLEAAKKDWAVARSAAEPWLRARADSRLEFPAKSGARKSQLLMEVRPGYFLAVTTGPCLRPPGTSNTSPPPRVIQ